MWHRQETESWRETIAGHMPLRGTALERSSECDFSWITNGESLSVSPGRSKAQDSVGEYDKTVYYGSSSENTG